VSATSGGKGEALDATVTTDGPPAVIDPDSIDFKEDQVARLKAKAEKQSRQLAETKDALSAAARDLAEAKRG